MRLCGNVLHVFMFLHCLHSDESRALSLKGGLSRRVLYACVEAFPSSNSAVDDVWLQSVLPRGGVMVTPPITALMHFPSVSHHEQETGKQRQRVGKDGVFSHTHTHTL